MSKAMTSNPSRNAAVFERHGLSDDQLTAIFENMLLQRQLDNRGFQLNRQGKIPFALGSEGHEALQAGAAMAFQRGKDMLVPYYRDLGLSVGIGFTPYEVLLSLFARAEDHNGGRQFPNHYSSKKLGLVSFSSILAAHIPHAVGIAYAFKLRKEAGRAVLVTFGDGTTSEGEWHESMNFAAVHKLPVVFLCENNLWAISTPLAKQMAIEDIGIKAHGYGMPGESFNGFDPIETFDVVRRALECARSGGGPTLVEGKCYRFLSHSTDDDDRTYRTREEIALQRQHDPVPRFERILIENNIMTSQQADALKKTVLDQTNDATDRAESMPYPKPDDLYSHVYEGAWQPWQ